MTLSRRTWLEVAAGAAGSAGLAAIGCGGRRPVTAAPAPVERPEPPEPAPRIEDEPSAGAFDPSPTGALLWAYTPRPAQFRIELADGSEAPPRALPVETTEAGGRTVTATVDDLAPDTHYRYRIAGVGAQPGRWHHLFTAPPSTADAPVHFVVAADLHTDPEFDSPILDIMRSTPARFAVSLGDWPYSDSPGPAAVSLADYRARYRAARLEPSVRRMMERLPLFSIYDDHELRNDWDAAFRRREPARFRAGLQAWDEWFPVRGAPDRRYRSWRWGANAELFLLDTRLYRDANDAPASPDKSMLGAEQKRWLFDGLQASSAAFKILFTTVPLAHGTTGEHWNAFTDERAELEAFLRSSKITGLVAITGDQHWFAAHRHPSGLREYQIGPTRAFLRTPPPPEPGVIARIETPNFGEVRIEPGSPPRLVFRCRDQRGALLYEETLTP